MLPAMERDRTAPPMPLLESPAIHQLLDAAIGVRRRLQVLQALEVPFTSRQPAHDRLPPEELALALALALFDDVLRRVPLAAAYVDDSLRSGRRLLFDHGALRTVAGPWGSLPPGRQGFERLLVPLGYERRGVYPLDRIGMTGHVFTHRANPERLPQYFVSELHPERFSYGFQQAVARVIDSSIVRI